MAHFSTSSSPSRQRYPRRALRQSTCAARKTGNNNRRATTVVTRWSARQTRGCYACLLYTSDAADDTPCVDL
eukprot:9399936-Pyramimonas_sp.AAC.1